MQGEPTMSEPGRKLGFFVEPSGECSSGNQPPAGDTLHPFDWLELPSSGLSFLRLTADGRLSLEENQPPWSESLAACEPLELGGHECLATVALNGREMRANAAPAPPLAVFQLGDAVRFEPAHLLHLTMRVSPYVGPPRQEHIGEICQFCRTPIRPETNRVYACARCGRAYHNETEDVAADERLACAALMGMCQQCNHPAVMEERFLYVPQQ
jgi:hypothetical protein